MAEQFHPAVTIYLITEFLESFFIATHGNRLSAIGSDAEYRFTNNAMR